MSLTSKLFLRKLFDNPKTLFRIIAYNPQNGKVRLITSLYKLHPIEKVVSCDDKTHHFEIAFSEPELEFIPDLTPEDKEAEQLKDDQRFDRDTKVAIQLSLDYSTAYKQLYEEQPHSTPDTVTKQVTQHD